MIVNGYKAPKVLVFCHQRRHLQMTYQYFNNPLKYLHNNCKAIFHSETEDDFKKHMHKEFKDTID